MQADEQSRKPTYNRYITKNIANHYIGIFERYWAKERAQSEIVVAEKYSDTLSWQASDGGHTHVLHVCYMCVTCMTSAAHHLFERMIGAPNTAARTEARYDTIGVYRFFAKTFLTTRPGSLSQLLRRNAYTIICGLLYCFWYTCPKLWDCASGSK